MCMRQMHQKAMVNKIVDNTETHLQKKIYAKMVILSIGVGMYFNTKFILWTLSQKHLSKIEISTV